MSCGKCVLGSHFFLYHKSITINVSWAGQDLACTPETVEGSLFIDNVLHKLEILYSSLTRLCFKRNPAESRAQIWRHNASKPPVASAAVHSLAVVLSLLIAPYFITRWYSLIKLCIRICVNIVQTLACITVSFDRQGFAEHQSGG